MTRVLVVGGGLAGLAAAIAMRDKSAGGVDVDVAEMSYTPNGAAMGMFNRAADALRELGVHDELAQINTVAYPSYLQFYGPDGSALSVGSGVFPDPGKPIGLIVYRPDLAHALANAASRAGARLLSAGLTVHTLTNGPTGVDVAFTDGGRAHYDLVIGADGVGSSIRPLVFGDRYQPRFVGEFSVRWITDNAALDLAPGFYLAPTGTFMYNSPKAGTGYVNCTFPTTSKKILDDEQARARLEEVFDGFTSPHVKELRRRLAADSDVSCRAFETVWVDEPWFRDRVVLIGDAAHATSAHLASGGAMALEDGVVLAVELAGDGTIDDALDRFYRRRRDRVKLIVETSLTLLEMEAGGEMASPEFTRLTTETLMTVAQPY